MIARRVRKHFLAVGFGITGPWLVGMSGCSDDQGGLTLPDSKAGHGGSGAGAGASALAGESGQPEPGTGGSRAGQGGGKGKGGSSTRGGSGGSSAATGGTGGTTAVSEAGATGEAGEPGSAGEGGSAEGGADGSGDTSSGGTPGFGGSGTGGLEPASACIYHSDPVPDAVGGMGGFGGSSGAGSGGGAGGPARSTGVAVATNPFIGSYLTDGAGFTLYIYGADLPGDCNHPPVSNCYADCLQSWPFFNAGDRTLSSTLDDAYFGTLDRGDGTYQTTYMGWPLYYYKTDTTTGLINGQGKGKTWFAAEPVLPNLMIMRGPVDAGGVKYLADDAGRTLYSLAGDTLGSDGVPPSSACTGACSDAFTPYAPDDVIPVTSIEPQDVTLFVRGDGMLQIAYKGAPLYYSASDTRSGDTLGIDVYGGVLVAP